MQEIVNFIVPLSISLIMLGIGLELCFRDFKMVFTDPKAIFIGLSNQMILLPLITFALVYYWPMDKIYKIGFMLLAACPGGTASNLVTKMLKGKVALSVSLTAFNSFIIVFSIPLVMQLSFPLLGSDLHDVQLKFTDTFQEIFLTVIIPVSLGILLNEYYGYKFTNKFHHALKYILPAIMLIAFLTVIFFDESQQEVNYLNHINLFIPLFILNITTILTGYLSSRRIRLNHKSAYTVAIEMGLQNSVLALFIANQVFKNKDISLVAVLYSSFSLITTFLMAWGIKVYLAPRLDQKD
ncbi:bile acid:sodium symporter family protein [Salegentibacter sp. F14]